MYFVHVYIYIYLKYTKKKIQKKISRFPNLSQKRENFSKKKKKTFFELGALDFLVAFSKKAHFFSYKDFKILKSFLFKMVHKDSLDKTFSKS